MGASRRAHAACVLCRLACASKRQFQSHIEYDGPHLRGMPAQGVRGQVSMSVDTCGRRCLLSRSQQAPLRHTRARPCKATRSDQRANKRTLRRTLTPSADTRAGVELVYLHRRPLYTCAGISGWGRCSPDAFRKVPLFVRRSELVASQVSNQRKKHKGGCRFQRGIRPRKPLQVSPRQGMKIKGGKLGNASIT